MEPKVSREEVEQMLADAPPMMGTAAVADRIGVTPKTVRLRCRA